MKLKINWRHSVETLQRAIERDLAEQDVDTGSACQLLTRYMPDIIRGAEHDWQRHAAVGLQAPLVKAAEAQRSFWVRRSLESAVTACEHALQAADWHAERASANQEKA